MYKGKGPLVPKNRNWFIVNVTLDIWDAFQNLQFYSRTKELHKQKYLRKNICSTDCGSNHWTYKLHSIQISAAIRPWGTANLGRRDTPWCHVWSHQIIGFLSKGINQKWLKESPECNNFAKQGVSWNICDGLRCRISICTVRPVLPRN